MDELVKRKSPFVGKGTPFLPKENLKYMEDIKNFEVRDSDIFVVSYPKAGTTWTQEMVWLIANNLDYDGAKTSLEHRFPFFEICCILDEKSVNCAPKTQFLDVVTNSVAFTKNLKSPRFIKSHLCFSLLPDDIRNNKKTPKIIYVMRNPKDVCVSYYHHFVLLTDLKMSLEDFCKYFLKDEVMYGSFWNHVMEFWERRHMPNLFIISYEDMKRDLSSVIRRVAAFLGKSLAAAQVQQLCSHLSFDSMKKNPAVNLTDLLELFKSIKVTEGKGQFLRSGVVGKYKEELSPELISQFDKWIKKNIEGTDFGKEYLDMVV